MLLVKHVLIALDFEFLQPLPFHCWEIVSNANSIVHVFQKNYPVHTLNVSQCNYFSLFWRKYFRQAWRVLTLCDPVVTWHIVSSSTLAQVMAYCLTAPSHRLNHNWLKLVTFRFWRICNVFQEKNMFLILIIKMYFKVIFRRVNFPRSCCVTMETCISIVNMLKIHLPGFHNKFLSHNLLWK